jgi:tetratricopeptide (TPR) repeat protein
MKKIFIFITLIVVVIFSEAQNKEAILNEALTALDNGRKLTAIDLFSNYIELDNNNPVAYFGRARAAYGVWRLRDKEDSEMYKTFMTDIYTSFNLDSTNSDCNYWIADNIEKARDLKVALSFYCRAIRYNKERERFYRSRAYCYEDLEMYSNAIEDYKTSNRLLNHEQDIVTQKRLKEDNNAKMSLCYAKIDDVNAAITSIKKSIKSNPKNNLYQLYYANYLTSKDLKNSKKSLSIYLKLINKNPHLGLAYLFIGNLYNMKGNQELAQEYYSKAKQMGFAVNEKTMNINNQIDLLL